LKNGLKTIQTERSISPRGGVTTQQFPKPQDERSRSNSCTRATVGRGKEGREGREGRVSLSAMAYVIIQQRPTKT